MHSLRWVSILLFVAGLLLMAAGSLFSLDPGWTLTGLLLAWAGLVKVIVVRLWRGIAAPGGAETSRRGDD